MVKHLFRVPGVGRDLIRFSIIEYELKLFIREGFKGWRMVRSDRKGEGEDSQNRCIIKRQKWSGVYNLFPLAENSSDV